MKRHITRLGFIVLLIAALALAGCTIWGFGQYRVSGKVVDAQGNGIPGVILDFGAGFGTAQTDDSGQWVKTSLKGEVTITPILEGWVFEAKTVKKAGSDINFTGNKLTYSLNVLVSGAGTVQKSLSGSEANYEHGTSVQLTAVPDQGWQFSSWQGDLNGSDNPAEVIMDGAKTVTAVFERLNTLTIESVGGGTVTVSPAQAYYTPGQTVTITAVPDEGNYLVRWLDTDAKELTRTLILDQSYTVGAEFAPIMDGLALTFTVAIVEGDQVKQFKWSLTNSLSVPVKIAALYSYNHEGQINFHGNYFNEGEPIQPNETFEAPMAWYYAHMPSLADAVKWEMEWDLIVNGVKVRPRITLQTDF